MVDGSPLLSETRCRKKYILYGTSTSLVGRLEGDILQLQWAEGRPLYSLRSGLNGEVVCHGAATVSDAYSRVQFLQWADGKMLFCGSSDNEPSEIVYGKEKLLVTKHTVFGINTNDRGINVYTRTQRRVYHHLFAR